MLIDEQKDWSPELKAKAKDFAQRNNIRHVHALHELIRFINWAREETEIETRATVKDWLEPPERDEP